MRYLLNKSANRILVFLIFLNFISNSQNQHTKWYFGKYAALDFMTNPPTTILTSALGFTANSGFNEGTSSIADAAGNLLFYTDGQTVWNQNNLVMANGTGLFGHYSASQSALIVKQPGNSNIYYLFTTDLNGSTIANNMCYSIIDMGLAAGLGSVTIKNAGLLNPSSEKLCAVKHANQQDVWIIGHAANSNMFVTYLLSSAGLSPGVPSSTGALYSNQNSVLANNNYGCMKASPMGTKLGVAIYNVGTAGPAYEVYDFDPANGTVSNPLTLLSSNYMVGHYGCEFSPDGSKFYGTFAAVNPTGVLYQWDLCAGANSAIIASQYTLTIPNMGQIQLAPDGKIYGSVRSQSVLPVINNPNLAGAACNYSGSGPSVSPNVCSVGLPNFVACYTGSLTPITSSVTCQSASFTTASRLIAGCGPSTQTVNSCMWLFGDPASAVANTSNLLNPTHIFTAPGTYTVKQVLYNFYSAPLDTAIQVLNISAIPSVYAGFQICSGSTLTLSFTGVNSYSWSTGATTSSITVNPSQNTTYTVQGLDVNMCLHTSIQSVTVQPLPQISITGSSSVCAGKTLTLIAAGATSYTWSTGENTASINISPAASTVYTLLGTDNNSCTSTVTSTVIVNPLPVLTIAGPTIICKSEAAMQMASGAVSYTWSTGILTNTVLLSPSVSTQYTVTGTDSSGCINSAFRTLSVTSCAGIEELKEVNEVRLYPNPSNGTFSLKFKTGSQYRQLKIVDQLGKTVFEKKSVTDGEQIKTHLPAGTYVYIVSGESENIIHGVLILE